jgi:hypothetical protein
MPLAPRGDIRRPLQLAIRSTRLLGIIFTLLGTLVMALSGAVGQRVGGTRGMFTVLMAAIGFVYLIPGILYIVFSIFLSRRQPWAVIATIVLAALHALFALLALAGTLLQGNMIGALLVGLWVAALAQLIFHLSQSFAAIRAEREQFAPRGFEPIPRYGAGPGAGADTPRYPDP